MPHDLSTGSRQPPVVRLRFEADALPDTFDPSPRAHHLAILEFVEQLATTAYDNWPAGRITFGSLPSRRLRLLAEHLLLSELYQLKNLAFAVDVKPALCRDLITNLQLILPQLRIFLSRSRLQEVINHFTAYQDAQPSHQLYPHHEYIMTQVELYAETEPTRWPIINTTFQDLFLKPEEPLLSLQESMVLYSLSRHLLAVSIPAEVRPQILGRLNLELATIQGFASHYHHEHLTTLRAWLTRYQQGTLRPQP